MSVIIYKEYQHGLHVRRILLVLMGIDIIWVIHAQNSMSPLSLNFTNPEAESHKILN